MSNILTLDTMKNLSADEIARLYQLGYRIEGLVDPIVNFGKVTVSTGYNNIATSIVLSTGEGANLPDPSIDGQYNLVWYNSTDYPDPSDDPNVEIVRVTAKVTDISNITTLTIVRAQEGTLASNKNTIGKTYRMILSPTKKTITDINAEKVSKVGDTMTGTLNLPANGLIVGTNQLAVSGGNVGIGTASPTQNLHISGIGTVSRLSSNTSGNPRYIIDNQLGALHQKAFDIIMWNTGILSFRALQDDLGTANYTPLSLDASTGNVGIGTTSPSGLLDVRGQAFIGARTDLAISAGGLNIRQSAAAEFLAWTDGSVQGVLGGVGGIPYIGSRNNASFGIYTNNTERMRINNIGDIGIGTIPGTKLDVNGTIRSSGIINTALAAGKLFADATGTLLSSSGVAFGNFTRDISLVSGTQSIIGVGFRPSSVIFIMGQDATHRLSVGFSNATSNYCVTNLQTDIAGWTLRTTECIEAYTGGGGSYYATVSSLDSDGFTLNWTKAGGATGIISIAYMAFR